MLRFGTSLLRTSKRHSALPRFAKASLPYPHFQGILVVRNFSDNESLKETLKKIKKDHDEKKSEEGAEGASAAGAEEANTTAESAEEAARKAREVADNAVGAYRRAVDWVQDNFKLAWDEMTGKSKPSAIERQVHQADSFRRPKAKVEGEEEAEEEVRYDGPTALVLVKDPVSAWERMKDRLKDAPLIKEILKNSKKIGEAAAGTDLGKQAQKVGQSVKDKLEDAREVWETSQNPIIYTLSGVWDNITGTTEEGMAIAEIRKFDPNFIKEEWAQEVRSTLTPTILKGHLSGDVKSLKPWCGEAVFNKLAADIRARKGDGITFDTNILDIEENQIIIKQLEDGGVAIVVLYMVQQINCVRNKAGEIIEGGENEIRMKYYNIAFQQEYNEDTGVVTWKVVDYQFAGEIPYL